MLTFGCARTHHLSRAAASFGVAFALAVSMSIMTLRPAQAQQVESGGCVGARYSFNCVDRWGPAGDPFVRSVPQPSDKADKERAAARERRWVDRCRPAIAQDRYGVARYHYAMPGCEFGVGEY